MLTINAYAHPLMRRMHKPDPKLPANQQDKRSVIPLEASNADKWLHGSMADAKALVRLAPTDFFRNPTGLTSHPDVMLVARRLWFFLAALRMVLLFIPYSAEKTCC